VKCKYVIITSIPVFNCDDGKYYTYDTWAKDIEGQLDLWKELKIVCPMKEIDEKTNNMVVPDEKINFITFSNTTSFFYLILNLFKTPNQVFEFAGTSNYGILAFIISTVFNRTNPKFITFDGPLSMTLNRNPNLSFKRILIIIYVKIMTYIRKYAASTATGLMAVGDGIIDEFDPKRKFENNYLIIPLTLFDDDELFYREYSTNKKIKIACIDRLSPEKGVYELLKAFKLISDNLDNVRLEIFGNGPQEKILKDFVRKEKIESIVTFHGFVTHEKIMEELKGIDILVNITKVGDINRTMWEGAVNGCAIIASDKKGVRSFFTNGINAILVNPNDIDEMATSLRTLCENPEIQHDISKNALKLAERHTNKKVKVMRQNWILKKIQKN